MLLKTTRAKFNPEIPIAFVNVLGKDYPCFFYTDERYDQNNPFVDVMFYGLQHYNATSKTPGAFQGFRVRSVRPDDQEIMFSDFERENRAITAQANLCDQNETFRISPGFFKDYFSTLEKGSASQGRKMKGWAKPNIDNSIMRLEGIYDFNYLDLQKVVNSIRQPR